MADLVPGHQCKCLLRIETRLADDQPVPEGERDKNHVVQPADPGPISGCPEDQTFFAKLEVVEEFQRSIERMEEAVSVQDALRHARRARGVNQQRRVLRPRRDRFKAGGIGSQTVIESQFAGGGGA